MGITVTSNAEQAAVAAAQAAARANEEKAAAAAAAAAAKAKSSTPAKSSPTASTAALVQSLGDKGTAITGSTPAKSSKATSAPKSTAGTTTSPPSSVSAFIPGASLFKPNTSVLTKTAASGVNLTALLTRAPGTSKTPLVVKSTAKSGATSSTASKSSTSKSSTSLSTGEALSQAKSRGAAAAASGTSTPVTIAAPADVAGADSEVTNANNILAGATSKYTADMALLKQDQTTLAKQKKVGSRMSGIRGIGGVTNSVLTTADETAVKNQEQAAANALKGVHSAQSNLTAAEKTQKTATTYQASAPTPTVNTKITRAVGKVLTKAEQTEANKKKAVTDDKTNLANTNADLSREDNLVADNPMFAGRMIGVIRPQLAAQGQQTTKLKSDTTALVTAQHNENATALAVGVVDTEQQGAADVSTFNKQYKQLQKSGVLNSKGAMTKSPLSGTQQLQFEKLMATADKVAPTGTDVTTIKQDLAGLQLDASKYNDAAGAVTSVNQVLEKYGLQPLSTPSSSVRVSAARAGVRSSTSAAKTADMQYDVDSRAATVTGQQQKVNTLLGQIKSEPSDTTALKGQLQKQDTTLESDEGSYGQAVSYQGQTQKSAALTRDGKAVSTALGRYKADPSSANLSALQKAQGVQSQDKEQLMVDGEGLYAASAEVDGAPELGQQYVGGQLQTALFNQENPGMSANAPANANLLKAATGAQSTGAAAGTSGQVQSFDYWNSAADRQAKLDEGWELQEEKSGVPVTSATQLTDLINDPVEGAWENSEAAAAAPQAAGGKLSGTQLQEDETTLKWQLPLSNSDFGQAQFNETQPADLLDPQLQSGASNQEQAQSEESQAWQSYAKQQGLTVKDPVAMATLNSLGAGQVADIQGSLQEIAADQTDATQVGASRPLSEQFFDLLSGQNPTASWNTSLSGTLSALTSLSGSAAQKNLQYEQEAGNLSGSDATFEQNATGNVQAWQQAQTVGADVIEGALMMADPLVGGIADLVLKQGLATADNYLTATEGGQVSADGEVTPAAAFTNNFGTGNDSPDEKQQAVVDAGSDVLTTAGMVAGAGAAEAAGAVTTRLGESLGIAGLEKVSGEGLSKMTQEEATQTLTRTLGVRLVSTGASWGTFGLVSGVAQDGGTAAQGLLAVAQGKQTRGQALSQIGDSLKGTVLGAGALAVFAPVGQALGEAVGAGVRSLSGAVGRAAVDSTESSLAASAVDAVDSGRSELGEPAAVQGEITDPAAGSDVSDTEKSAAARQLKFGQFGSLLAGNFGPTLASGHVDADDLAADIGNTVAGSAAEGMRAAGDSETGEAGEPSQGSSAGTPPQSGATEGEPTPLSGAGSAQPPAPPNKPPSVSGAGAVGGHGDNGNENANEGDPETSGAQGAAEEGAVTPPDVVQAAPEPQTETPQAETATQAETTQAADAQTEAQARHDEAHHTAERDTATNDTATHEVAAAAGTQAEGEQRTPEVVDQAGHGNGGNQPDSPDPHATLEATPGASPSPEGIAALNRLAAADMLWESTRGATSDAPTPWDAVQSWVNKAMQSPDPDVQNSALKLRTVLGDSPDKLPSRMATQEQTETMLALSQAEINANRSAFLENLHEQLRTQEGIAASRPIDLDAPFPPTTDAPTAVADTASPDAAVPEAALPQTAASQETQGQLPEPVNTDSTSDNQVHESAEAHGGNGLSQGQAAPAEEAAANEKTSNAEVPALRNVPPERPVMSRLKQVGNTARRVAVIPTLDPRSLLSLKTYTDTVAKLVTDTSKEAGVRLYAAIRNKPLLDYYPSTVDREIRNAGLFHVYDDPATGQRVPVSRVRTYQDPGLTERSPVVSVRTYENPAVTEEWIPRFNDAMTGQPIPTSLDGDGRRVIAATDTTDGQPRVIAYADPATGRWYLSANTYPLTGEAGVIPAEHGDGTQGVRDVNTPLLQGDWSKPAKAVLDLTRSTPRYANSSERTAREITLTLTGLERVTFLNEKFEAPTEADEKKYTALGDVVRHLLPSGSRDNWSDTDRENLSDYVGDSLSSVDPAVHAATRDALVRASTANPDSVSDLINAYGKRAPSAVKQLSKLDLNNVTSKDDVYGLVSVIGQSLRSGNAGIKGAAENIATSISDDDLDNILAADYASPHIGSKNAGGLSGNTVATVDLILDTAGPEMLAAIGRTAPDLLPEVEARYSGLQGKGLDDRYATGRMTKPAYDAMTTLLKTSRQSTDKTLVAAAPKVEKALGDLKPGEAYTAKLLDAFSEFMKADQETTWIGGSKIAGSRTGELSSVGEVISRYLAKQTNWSTDSVRLWKGYMSALRDSPDGELRVTWQDANNKLNGASPKADQPISEMQRSVWNEVSKADTASWWEPDLNSIGHPKLSREANSILMQEFGFNGQSPINAWGDMLASTGEDKVGMAKSVWHSATPVTSAAAEVVSSLGIPLLNGYVEADYAENGDAILPLDPKDPSKGFHLNMWHDPTGDESKPWVLGADLTLYVQPHLEYRPGPSVPLHHLGLPVAVFARGVFNHIEYAGVDALGRPGRQVIARGTRLTGRQGQFLEQMVRFGGTNINDKANAAFGAFATSPPWRLVTTPLLNRFGLSDKGPDWFYSSAIGGVLLHPASETDTIQLVQVRRDRGIELGAGISLIPWLGKRSIRAAPYQPEYTLNDKLVRPRDVRADSARWAIAKEHQGEAQKGVQKLASELQRLAVNHGGSAGQWPGSSAGQAALNAIMTAAEEGLSLQTTAALIGAMNTLKKESGGALSLDTRVALGNSFWEPGKIWMPDQFDAAMSLFRADIGQSPPAS